MFFKNVRCYKSADKPPEFNIRSRTTGGLLQCHLEPDKIPETFTKNLPHLELWQVSGRLRHIKKPKSMVEGDIFPQLVTFFSDQLAVPLADLYNTISRITIWPII